MPPRKAKVEGESKEKRLAEKAGIGQGTFEGEKIDKKDIEGLEVILVDFRIAPSRYPTATGAPRDYVTLQLEVDGELRFCSLSGQVVVEALKRVDKDKDLPAPVIFLKEKTEDGKRTYWTMK